MRSTVLVVGAIVLVAGAVPPVPVQAAGALAVRAEVGAEQDNNPARLERIEGGLPPTIKASPAGRFVLGVDAQSRLGQRLLLSFSGAGAGKAFVFTEAREESVLVAQATAAAGVTLGRGTMLSLAGGYYDAFQHRHVGARDFRSLSPTLRLEHQIAQSRLFAGAGWRWFTFKQESDFDFSGPLGFAGWRLSLNDPGADNDAAEWELAATASYEARSFTQNRCPGADDCPPAMPMGKRRDDFVVSQFEVTRTSGFLLGVGGGAHFNLSNSYGESLQRFIAFTRGAFLLPWQLTLSTRIEVLLTRYDERLPLARDVSGMPLVSIEDESRSTVRLELDRPISEHVDVLLRYTFFTSAPSGGPVAYDRHVVMVALAATWDR